MPKQRLGQRIVGNAERACTAGRRETRIAWPFASNARDRVEITTMRVYMPELLIELTRFSWTRLTGVLSCFGDVEGGTVMEGERRWKLCGNKYSHDMNDFDLVSLFRI